MTIICPEHGEFLQSPRSHLRSKTGCPKCAYKNTRSDIKMDTESFIKRCKEKYGDKYDYSKVNYVNSRTNVTIICPIHGEFSVCPNNFLRHIVGCPRCGNYLTKEAFVEKANKIHNNKYDYSKFVRGFSGHDKSIIICPIHGEFEQQLYAHLQGQGCPKCGQERSDLARRGTTEFFIRRAKEIHSDKYDYSRVKYGTNCDIPVEIVCPIHGSFWQTPHTHLHKKGCPICRQSYGEKDIEKYLIAKNYKFKYQHPMLIDKVARKTNKVVFDFYLELFGKQIAIEFHGEQHYKQLPFFHKTEEDFYLQQQRDRIVREYCLNNNICLLEIKYDDKNIDEIITSFLEKLK